MLPGTRTRREKSACAMLSTHEPERDMRRIVVDGPALDKWYGTGQEGLKS